jgi:hypothetical protein
MTDEELLAEVEAQQNLMSAVATGGPRIDDVNREYMERRERIADELRRRDIPDPNPYGDLWRWYGRRKRGDMPTYQSRREHISDLYQPLIDRVRAAATPGSARVFEEPIGWPRVDRGIEEIRRRLEEAQTEEQSQAVGLLCREVLISAAQVVYDADRHASADGIGPSYTDAKRMLDNYFATELPGGANEGLRRHAKAALSLANDLQHSRTADYRQAALCAEATTSVVNIVAIVSGGRDRSAQ